MSKKYLKIYPPSLAIQKPESKLPWDYISPTKISSRKQRTTNGSKDIGREEALLNAGDSIN